TISGLTGSGTINLGGATFSVSGAGTFGGLITGPGNLSKITGSTLTLTGHNSYTGFSNFQNNSAQLNLGIENALPINTLLESLGTTNTNVIFDMMGFNQRVASVQGLTTTGTVFIQNSGTTLSTLTVSNGSTSTGNALTTGNFGLRDGSPGAALALTVI